MLVKERTWYLSTDLLTARKENIERKIFIHVKASWQLVAKIYERRDVE